TLAGVILGLAGFLAWLSLQAVSQPGVVRRATHLCNRPGGGSVCVVLVKKERYQHRCLAAVAVYVLATAAYVYTLGQYVGRALGASPRWSSGLSGSRRCTRRRPYLIGIHEPSGVQIAAVWIELAILAVRIAALG
ncbi:MAG: hypothetical protein QM784_29180, partial [Polyangiaceae bacterium]